MSNSPRPDPRWSDHLPCEADLISLVERWTVGAAVPAPVAEVLGTARKLLVDSYRAFEYSLVSVGWALFALEVTMHDCTMLIGPNSARRTFGGSISKAQRSGMITQEEATTLRQTADLRNRIVHGYLLPNLVLTRTLRTAP